MPFVSRPKQVRAIFPELDSAAAKHQTELGPDDDVDVDVEPGVDVQHDAVEERDDGQRDVAASQCRCSWPRRLEGEISQMIKKCLSRKTLIKVFIGIGSA